MNSDFPFDSDFGLPFKDYMKEEWDFFIKAPTTESLQFFIKGI